LDVGLRGREEITGCWRTLQNEELSLITYCPNDVIRKGKTGWDLVCRGEIRYACRIFVRKLEGKRPRGKPENRWKGNSVG
jgi:hypothetical protein